VPIFLTEPASERADSFLKSRTAPLIVSDYAAAEFASAIARRHRMGDITRAKAIEICASFDTWRDRAQRVETTTRDIATAERFLRRLDLTLRMPDALNIALAQRLGAALATFDTKMAGNARALGAETALL
jgi:predicted nucleic acid-binding protein